MTVGFANALLDDPFFLGSISSNEVPGKWAVALDGRGFLIDDSKGQFLRQTLPLLRQQADNADRPAEHSINPEDLWRRAAECWHLGAGQSRFDRDTDSSPCRFRTSKGVDPWTKWELSLLPDTARKLTSANTNLMLAAAGGFLYVADGSTLRYTTDITAVTPTWTAVTYAGGAIKALSSDGYNVYLTDGANVYSGTRGAASVAVLNAVDVDVVSWTRAKARLMGALNTGATRSVYNITGAAAPTDIAPNIISADFTWVAFCDGPTAIYGAGFQGDKSLVFRWGIKSDGTGLDAAVPALPDGLPDGEIIRAVGSYLGFVLLGTDKGVRFCQVADAAGNLTVGPLIQTGLAVRCFEGQDRFIWYGLTNLDGTSTGLGRLDLLSDTGQATVPTPAYAPDLMAATQGDVVSVATFQDRRVFSVAGSGVWAQTADLVASGYVDSGSVGYGLPDDKIAMFLDVRNDPLVGSVAASLAVDSGTMTQVGVNDAAGSVSAKYPVGQQRGASFETRITLGRSVDDTTTGPTLTRWTLLANPAPERRERFVVRYLLSEKEQPRSRSFETRSPRGDLDFIRALHRDQRAVRFQAGNYSATVTVDDWEMDHDGGPTRDRDYWNGACTVVHKVLE